MTAAMTPPIADTNAYDLSSALDYSELGLHHAAIIMDGNRRWARQQDMPTITGHQAGVATLKKLIEVVGQQLEFLTVYAFSTENWRRTEDELSGLMGLFGEALVNELRPLHEQNVRVRFLGDGSVFPTTLQSAMVEMTSLTENNTGLTLQIAMNYGGRAEIIHAVNQLNSQSKPITEDNLNAALMTGTQPSPDLLIRTGGEQRLSNFLLWQAAYAELAFVDTLWPDFTPEAFNQLAINYANRHRRYGK